MQHVASIAKTQTMIGNLNLPIHSLVSLWRVFGVHSGRGAAPRCESVDMMSAGATGRQKESEQKEGRKETGGGGGERGKADERKKMCPPLDVLGRLFEKKIFFFEKVNIESNGPQSLFVPFSQFRRHQTKGELAVFQTHKTYTLLSAVVTCTKLPVCSEIRTTGLVKK